MIIDFDGEADGMASAVASGFKYVMADPLTFKVPVVKQFVPAPPDWAKMRVTDMLRFKVVGTLVMLMVDSAPFTPGM